MKDPFPTLTLVFRVGFCGRDADAASGIEGCECNSNNHDTRAGKRVEHPLLLNPNIARSRFDPYCGAAAVHVTGNVVALKAAVCADWRIAMYAARSRLCIQ